MSDYDKMIEANLNITFLKEAMNVLEQFNKEPGFYKKMVWELAKSHPKILVDVAKRKKYITDEETRLRTIIMCHPDEKIRAIKAIRKETGWGLLEAKDYVEKVLGDLK